MVMQGCLRTTPAPRTLEHVLIGADRGFAGIAAT
jgi:hypothetical protein